jgi:hypothetical protein
VAHREVRVEEFLSRRVQALNGRVIGRIKEMRAEPRGKQLIVVEYLLGPAGLLERLSVRLSALPLLGRFAGNRSRRYKVRWQQMDLSDAKRPRLRCSVEELENLQA